MHDDSPTVFQSSWTTQISAAQARAIGTLQFGYLGQVEIQREMHAGDEARIAVTWVNLNTDRAHTVIIAPDGTVTPFEKRLPTNPLVEPPNVLTHDEVETLNDR
jgi:hypothetical protein